MCVCGLEEINNVIWIISNLLFYYDLGLMTSLNIYSENKYTVYVAYIVAVFIRNTAVS
jgi:hypothetical protein